MYFQRLTPQLITNKEQYLNSLDNAYGDIRKEPLNPKMRQRISDFIGDDTAKIWDNHAGFPGMHAEVRAVNSLLNKGVSMKKIKVSTHKVAHDKCGNQGKEFPACTNCAGILDGYVDNIVTGVKK